MQCIVQHTDLLEILGGNGNLFHFFIILIGGFHVHQYLGSLLKHIIEGLLSLLWVMIYYSGEIFIEFQASHAGVLVIFSRFK